MSLARSLAWGEARRRPWVQFDEFLSPAYEGLVNAARTWDPDRGVPFRAYATTRIEGALLDAARSSDWASRSVRTNARAVNAARWSLVNDLGRVPTLAEVAAEAGMTEAAVRKSDKDVRQARLVWMDAEPVTGPVVDGPEQVVMNRWLLSTLEDAVNELPARLQVVVRGSFLQRRPLVDMATELGVTETRVWQLRKQAMGLLRTSITGRCA